ncbi:MAG: cytochrome c3 family protein [Verrucomicrobiota bacterium]
MTKCGQWCAVAAGVWLVSASVLLLSSCSTLERTVAVPLEIEGATFVGNSSCVECHKNVTQVFPGSPHARVRVGQPGAELDTSCESCHGPGSKHAATAKAQFIINPRKNSEACLTCHRGTEAEFRLPHHHPLPEGKMNCAQCHDPHGHDIMKPAGGLAMARLNQSCAECHREQTRQFVFEHEAMREGCVACHNVHGSINPKMLVQRDPNLCLKCHAQTPGAAGAVVIGKVDHSLFLRQGTCWSAGCHTAVHGSNINPHLRY